MRCTIILGKFHAKKSIHTASVALLAELLGESDADGCGVGLLLGEDVVGLIDGPLVGDFEGEIAIRVGLLLGLFDVAGASVGSMTPMRNSSAMI